MSRALAGAILEQDDDSVRALYSGSLATATKWKICQVYLKICEHCWKGSASMEGCRNSLSDECMHEFALPSSQSTQTCISRKYGPTSDDTFTFCFVLLPEKDTRHRSVRFGTRSLNANHRATNYACTEYCTVQYKYCTTIPAFIPT